MASTAEIRQASWLTDSLVHKNCHADNCSTLHGCSLNSYLCQYTVFTGLTFKNSLAYHIWLYNMLYNHAISSNNIIYIFLISSISNHYKMKKLLYFEWSPPWHVGWRLSGEGCHWEYDGKNGEFENIDFRFPWLSDTSEMGFGHDVPFLNYSDRLPHPSDLCQPDQVRVEIQLISWNVFCYSQLRRLTGSNLLTFFLTYLLTFFLTYISSDIHSDISSVILSDIFLTYLLTFFLTTLLTLFLTYLLTFFLTYLSTCFLTYLLTFFLTYQNQNLTSTASHKKPLCKLYIYVTPRSKSNIHDNFVPVNVIALSASDRPAKRQLSPKMQNACSSTHTHTTCIRPPRQTAVESKNAKEFEVPQLHLMACANHEVRCSPLRFFRRICIGGPAPQVICLPLMRSILPKRGRSTKDCSALLQLLLALRIWNRPPFICHIPLVSLHDFFHDKHQIPSMCSARRLHAQVHALSTNTSQLVAPHTLNSFGHLIGSPNEDRLRTFHHNLRHGCQTKLTSLHKNTVEPTVLAAVCQIKQKTRCHPQDSVGANLNSCYPDLCMHIYLGHIFWHSAWHSFWLIFWHSSWHIF